jgi:hypothetical protein
MTEAVIARIDSKAQGQTAQTVFTNRLGIPIGDVAMEMPYDPTRPKDLAPEDVTKIEDLPGVHIPDMEGSDEIPGVDITDQDYTDHADVDVGVDFDSPVPEEPTLVDTGTTDAVESLAVGGTPGNPGGVRRSTRERKQVMNWQPAMKGKKYVFAALELAANELGGFFYQEEDYQYNDDVLIAFMQQLSCKSALNKWGSDAEQAGIKEASQLHWRDTFVPKHYSDLQDDQKKKVLESHMFVVKKRDGKTKARMVAGGNTQRDYLTKEDSSSPTVSTKAVILTSIVDAKEKRIVAVVDIPNAFIQTRVDNAKDRVIIRIRGIVVEWLVQIAPEIYGPYVIKDKKGVQTLLVECWNAIYGTMIAGLLYCRKFSESLTEKDTQRTSTTLVYGTRPSRASSALYVSTYMTAEYPM